MFDDEEECGPIPCKKCRKKFSVPFSWLEHVAIYDIDCPHCWTCNTYDHGPVKQRLDEFVERKIRERDAADRDAAASDEDDIDDGEELE